MKYNKPVMVGAALAAATLVGLSSVSMVSAATDTAGTSSSSIVDKLAGRFNLNKDEVQAVFDEDRQARLAERQAEHKQRLAQAVTDGVLTQEQADHITKAQTEIKALMGDARPGEQGQAVREDIRTKMEALRTWADDSNIDMRYVMGGGHGHRHGHGGPS